MDNSTRLQYLEAMGVDVWVPREQGIIEAERKQAVDENVSDEPPAHNPVSTNIGWNELERQVVGCEKCILSKSRKQVVLGEGDINADWMLVGEAPNHEEDIAGKPFVGQSGFLLTEMLRAIGVQRDVAYITNIIKCSPPDHKDPKVDELKSCDGYLKTQIALVKPKIILAVGRVAAHAILGTKKPISELRGTVHYLNDIPVIVVYHPAYLLRTLLEKRKAWQDLQLALKIYQEK
ncbi:MAG: uracil-DNA glycosylase [Methylococcales bacterium]